MMPSRPFNRAKAIREFVATRPRGATLSEILNACQPGWATPPTTDAERDERGRELRRYAAQTSMLAHKGKLAKVRIGKRMRYFATETALVDERKRNPEAEAKAPRQARAPKRANRSKPKPPPRAKAARVEPVARPRMVLVPKLGPNRNGAIDSDRIAADVAAFLRSGGRIQKLAHGESSQPMRSLSMHDVHDKSWRIRANSAPTDEIDDVA